MRHPAAWVLSWVQMRQPIDDLEMMRAQVAQSLLEHEIVAQALRLQSIVSALFILILGSLCFFLWQRHAYLFAAFLAEINRHSNERIALVKQHSLEQSSTLMQVLHAFEGIVSRKRSSSASTHHSSTSAAPPAQPSTSSPPPLPIPPPLPLSVTGRRKTPTQ